MTKIKLPIKGYYKRNGKLYECVIISYVNTRDGYKVVAEVEGKARLLKKSNVYLSDDDTLFVEGTQKIKDNIQRIDILNIVSDLSNITLNQLKSKTRTRPIAYSRYIYIALCFKFRLDTLKEIASEIGNIDHSSVIHGKKLHVELMKQDSDYMDIYNRCEAEIMAII